MLLGKVVVQTKRHAAVEAQPNPQTVSTEGQVDANWMLKAQVGCYGNEGAGDLRAVMASARMMPVFSVGGP